MIKLKFKCLGRRASLISMKHSAALEEALNRFWLRVNKRGPYPHKKACKLYPEIKGTRCWEFSKMDGIVKGYGRFSFKGKNAAAHRFIWFVKRGKIPKGLNVCHKCDNPACQRDLHHFLGTRRANMHDMVHKNRRKEKYGERCIHSKLSNKEIKKIRKMYATGLYFYKDLGIVFNTHASNIGAIVRRETFKFVKKT